MHDEMTVAEFERHLGKLAGEVMVASGLDYETVMAIGARDGAVGIERLVRTVADGMAAAIVAKIPSTPRGLAWQLSKNAVMAVLRAWHEAHPAAA